MSQINSLSGSAAETFLPKLIMMGLMAYTVGLLIDAICNVIYIDYGVSLGTVVFLISGIMELGVGGLLLIRAKYILSASGPIISILSTDPMLKFLLYLVPTYVLLRGIAFIQYAIVTGIGLIGAGALIFALIILNTIKTMAPSTATLTNLILTLLIGAFFGLAGFSMAESSLPNTLLMYSGILGISVIIAGLGFLITSLAPTATNAKEIIIRLSYILATIALIVGGALAIKDGIFFTRFPGIIMAVGALYLVAGILGGILAGVLFIVIVIMDFIRMLSRAVGVPPPPPPPPPPPS